MSDGPFSRVLALDDIGPEGRSIRIGANDAEREALARALDLGAVLDLDAALHVTVSRDRVVRVTGALSARVRQTCVVTLDPVTNDIAEPIDLTLVAAGKDDAARATGTGIRDGDPPDVFTGGQIDLGRIVAEFVALGIDPYPKAPGVEFSPHIEVEDAAENGPFAVLKRLVRGEPH